MITYITRSVVYIFKLKKNVENASRIMKNTKRMASRSGGREVRRSFWWLYGYDSRGDDFFEKRVSEYAMASVGNQTDESFNINAEF